ncbi:hypothetical protein PF008_g10195 [Phytophthora fragariae]|uniref:Uncharacterized protein n=1 Tax=Phytophthora fragariae TaxID=53985 RepID=A0A6G0RUY6_9STRA|nr:hypothetical protein PF008_g10195 [Phytophthora fragariae]
MRDGAGHCRRHERQSVRQVPQQVVRSAGHGYDDFWQREDVELPDDHHGCHHMLQGRQEVCRWQLLRGGRGVLHKFIIWVMLSKPLGKQKDASFKASFFLMIIAMLHHFMFWKYLKQQQQEALKESEEDHTTYTNVEMPVRGVPASLV